jgi:hypothetical protein
MKIVANNIFYHIRGDATDKIKARTWDEAKEPYADHLIDLLTADCIPNLKRLILKRVVQSPVDVERRSPARCGALSPMGHFCHIRRVPCVPFRSWGITGRRWTMFISAPPAATREAGFPWPPDAMPPR